MVGFGNIMKAAQDFQKKMEKAQQEIADLRVEGQSGAGIVKVTVNGNGELLKIDASDELFEEDKEIVLDLIVAAYANANEKAKEEAKSKMEGAKEGLPLPENFKMPF